MTTPFNPDNKLELTYGEVLGPAMEITEQGDADQYYNAYVLFLMAWRRREGRPPEEYSQAACESIVQHNLGYHAGYYGPEVQARVQQLFRAVHPIFGPV